MKRIALAVLAISVAGCANSAIDPQPNEVAMSAAQLNGTYVGTVNGSTGNCFRPQTTMRARVNGTEVTGNWEGGMNYSTRLAGNGFRTELTARRNDGSTYQITVRGRVQPGGQTMAAEFFSTTCTFSGTLAKQR